MTIERRIAKGAAWTVSLRLLERSIGLVSVLILARLLTPEDFGLVAMGTVILGALEAMSAFGFEWALIQRQAKDRNRWDTAWTLNIIIGLCQAVLLIALIPAVERFYSEPRVANVMWVLAACALVGGVRNIGMVGYEQDLEFKRIFALSLARRLTSFSITLLIAWLHGTYWALLMGILAGNAADAIFSYVFSPYRPRLRLAEARDLMSFSKWMLFNNLLTYANSRGSDMIIGHRSGATALGTFAVANELASLPTNELAAPIMRAVFPGYAMMSSDRSRLAHGFLKVLSLMLLLIIPAAAGVAVLADIFVFVLLGAKWEAAVPLVQVLAIVGAMRAIQSNAGTVYLAIDKPHLMTALTFVSVVVGLGSFSIFLTYQSVEVAVWALAATAVLTGILHFALMQRLLSLPAGSLLLPFFRPLLGVVAMCFVLHALADLLWTGQRYDSLTSAGFLLAGVLVGASTYMLIVYGAWRSAGRPAESPEQALLTAAGEVVRRLRPSIAERT